MTGPQIIFYLIAAFLLATGIAAVTSTNVFRSAIWLLFCLTGIAAIYFWLQVAFIAAVQIAVYVGGIVVLIIFSVFLTQQAGRPLPKPGKRKVLFSLLAVLFGFGLSYQLIIRHPFQPAGTKPFAVSVSEMGTQMLSPAEHGYILPFEVVSILLLAAMIGCIVIAMKRESTDDKETGTIAVIPAETAPPVIMAIPPAGSPAIIENDLYE